MDPKPDDAGNFGASLLDVCAKWDPSEAVETLKNVSLDVKSSQKCGIIGAVGSGKVSEVFYKLHKLKFIF